MAPGGCATLYLPSGRAQNELERIIKRSTLAGYWRTHRTAEQPLRQWLAVTVDGRWQSLMDVRHVFPHADAVAVATNTLTVFNVAANNYWLVVAIKYRWGVVYIRDFRTHAEYDDQRWKARH